VEAQINKPIHQEVMLVPTLAVAVAVEATIIPITEAVTVVQAL
jgi:hypothetical protein